MRPNLGFSGQEFGASDRARLFLLNYILRPGLCCAPNANNFILMHGLLFNCYTHVANGGNGAFKTRAINDTCTHTLTHTPIIAGAAEAPELSTVELLLTTTTTMPTTTIALVETARTVCSSETPAQIVFAVPQTNGEYNVFRREMRWKSNTPTNANANAITAQSAGTFIRLAGIAFESELNTCNEKRFMPRKWRTNCNRHTYASTHTHTPPPMRRAVPLTRTCEAAQSKIRHGYCWGFSNGVSVPATVCGAVGLNACARARSGASNRTGKLGRWRFCLPLCAARDPGGRSVAQRPVVASYRHRHSTGSHKFCVYTRPFAERISSANRLILLLVVSECHPLFCLRSLSRSGLTHDLEPHSVACCRGWPPPSTTIHHIKKRPPRVIP